MIYTTNHLYNISNGISYLITYILSNGIYTTTHLYTRLDIIIYTHD